MKKIRTLLVTFSNNLGTAPLTAFRGAIIEKVGRENILFHNHLSDEKFVYKYPLIQYKIVNGQPAIYCLDAGVDELYKLFEKKTWIIDLKGTPLKLEVEGLDLKTNTLAISNQQHTYSIRRWQALNEDNHRKYLALSSMIDKLQMLEKILIGNILSFAKGIDWHIEEKVEVKIVDMPASKPSRVKDIKVDAFDLTFKTNIQLPCWMGLGKGASTGFGVIKEIKNKQSS